ncbi:MAG: geranylgeranylglycerol-phosphate geranylgeranyltransferase [Candidatus Thorarchaeota archaeon]
MSQEQLSTASERRTDPKAFISILRPQNCVIGGLTVIAGIAIAYRMNPVGLLGDYALNFLFGYITYFFVAGGGNVINDIFDIEVDRINRPHRALPSGRMTVRQAWAYVILLSVMGVFFAWLNGIWGSVVVIVFLIVGYAYASKVKELGLAGNFLVAFSFAFGVIYGAFVYGELVGAIMIPTPAWLFFITAFMILQARETIKGAEDVEGDRLRDVRTVARVYGYKVAALVAFVFNMIGVICYVLIWVLGYASWDLWPLLLLGAGVVIGAAIAPLTGPDDKKALLIGSTLDKVGALVGLIAFVIIPLYGVVL